MAGAKFIFAAIVILYPAIVFVSLDYLEPRLIAVGLILLALARLFLAGRPNFISAGKLQSYLVVFALLLVGLTALASNSVVLLQYYPVYLSVFMLGLFWFSLIHPPSIVEQIARLSEKKFPEAGVRYARKVTMVWCGFFAFNGMMSLYSILAADMEFWVIYNGLISYCLMGLLFIGEYFARRRARRAVAPSQGGNSWVE
jgi:uncharacterized membrane protein